ncbi:MAG: UDP-N-acetylmuramate dehydrogenase [Tepidisphaeraceae bacterium]
MSLKLSSPFRGLEAIVEEGASLRRHTWYRIGGPAQYLVRPRSIEELREAVLRCGENGLPMRVLGLGANLLVRDEGVDGAVLKLDDGVFGEFTIDGELVKCGAGVDLGKLIVQTIRAGLAGIEVLAGIPATIGGAVRMNAGGKFGDIGAVVEAVTVMDSTGVVTTLAKHEVLFGYRHTDIAAPIIVGADLRLEKDEPDEITRRYKEVWMYKQNTQPLNAKSCGCIFKNPGDGRSAGALIDQAGLKGFSYGRAEVSTKHANFVIAHPDCPSDDVLALVKHVQQRVQEKHGVLLLPEVQVWPALTVEQPAPDAIRPEI